MSDPHGTVAVHEMPFGASLRSGGGADFRLWAPAAKDVALELQNGPGTEQRQPALRLGDGWWHATVAGAQPAPAPSPNTVVPQTPVSSKVTLKVNGQQHTIAVDTRTTLLDLLREQMHLTGTKKG